MAQALHLFGRRLRARIEEAAMTRLEHSDRIARFVLIAAVSAACVSPFALGAWKESGQPDPQVSSRLFDRLDANRDGMVAGPEAQQVPGLEAVFSRADVDHDGRLSRDEFFSAQALMQNPAAAGSGNTAIGAVKVKGAMVERQYLPSLALGEV